MSAGLLTPANLGLGCTRFEPALACQPWPGAWPALYWLVDLLELLLHLLSLATLLLGMCVTRRAAVLHANVQQLMAALCAVGVLMALSRFVTIGRAWRGGCAACEFTSSCPGHEVHWSTICRHLFSVVVKSTVSSQESALKMNTY